MTGDETTETELALTPEQRAILDELDAKERRQALKILEQVLRPPVDDSEA